MDSIYLGDYGLISICAWCGKEYEPDGPAGYYCVDEKGVHDARPGELTP